MRLLLKGRNFSSLYPFGYKNPMEKETKSMLNITAINNDCSVINSALKILELRFRLYTGCLQQEKKSQAKLDAQMELLLVRN